MKNILVTGGAGFIGSNFVRILAGTNEDFVVTNLDALTYAGSPENLKDLPETFKHELVVGSICDYELVESIIRDREIDTIVHFAAETHVDRSIFGPGLFIETNINGTFNLLEAARKVWLTEKDASENNFRFHHVSTDEVYGTLSPEDPAFSEETPYSPNSPYSASKASSDHLVRAYHETYGLPVSITNCSNNYGPHQFPEKFIPVIILNALSGKPIPVYGDGRQIRDWLYVDDHCEAIYHVIKNAKVGETYNVGGDNQPTNLEIIKRVCEVLDEMYPESENFPHESLITYVKDRPGHDRRYAMNINKIGRDLGWEPKTGLHEGLAKTVKWYINNSDWVKNVQKSDELKAWENKNYTEREKSV